MPAPFNLPSGCDCWSKEWHHNDELVSFIPPLILLPVFFFLHYLCKALKIRCLLVWESVGRGGWHSSSKLQQRGRLPVVLLPSYSCIVAAGNVLPILGLKKKQTKHLIYVKLHSKWLTKIYIYINNIYIYLLLLLLLLLKRLFKRAKAKSARIVISSAAIQHHSHTSKLGITTFK